jgi:ribonuclease HII
MSRNKQNSFTFEEGLVPSLYFFEAELTAQGFRLIAGVDEAGRGPLAGPVVAACVILCPGQKIPGVNDSKKLTEKKRDELCKVICAEAFDFGVGVVDAEEIDRINILEAARKAMLLAVQDLRNPPDYILLDAMTIPIGVPQKSLIKGDSRSASIAAASILAKTTRDRIMVAMHEQHPEYGFAGHKGYCCKTHFDALKAHGPCPFHRRSFNGVLNP